MWWAWVIGGLLVWTAVAVGCGVVIGKIIHFANRPGGRAGDVGRPVGRSVARPAARPRRRTVPLPPIGVALAAVAVALQTAGFTLELSGHSGATARLLSMDAPTSVPSMFVTGIFAATAVAAVLAAGRMPGRRTWWSAVAVVAAGIAAVEADGTLHTGAMARAETVVGTSATLASTAAVALAVVAGLWFLSRHERRDRRRVLGALSCYAAAAVGLSAVSWVIEEAYGGTSTIATATTYLQEAGVALAGVAFLVSVLVGAAPRLVLPADWALRRTADAETLEVRDALPGRPVIGDGFQG